VPAVITFRASDLRYAIGGPGSAGSPAEPC